jgi:hypothetical protein
MVGIREARSILRVDRLGQVIIRIDGAIMMEMDRAMSKVTTHIHTPNLIRIVGM